MKALNDVMKMKIFINPIKRFLNYKTGVYWACVCVCVCVCIQCYRVNANESSKWNSILFTFSMVVLITRATVK